MSKRKRMNRNQAFAEQIRQRYERVNNYFGSNLVYRKQQKNASQLHIHKNWQSYVSNMLAQRALRYEKKYYQTIEGRDRNRLLRSVEEIYRHPGEKKQLIHLFRKFGLVSREHREWQESSRRLSRYEEELSVLHRQFREQEEYLLRLKQMENEPQILSKISRLVMQKIKNEIQLERMRHGQNL